MSYHKNSNTFSTKYIKKSQKVISIFVVIILLATTASSIFNSNNVEAVTIEDETIDEEIILESEDDQETIKTFGDVSGIKSVFDSELFNNNLSLDDTAASSNDYSNNYDTKSKSLFSTGSNKFADFIKKIANKFPKLAQLPFFQRLLERFDDSDGDSDNTGDDDIGGDDAGDTGDDDIGGDDAGDTGDDDIGGDDTFGDDTDDDDKDGNVVIVPESGHIALGGNGYIELDTILDINGTWLVTLQGAMYLSTGIESVDIWWNRNQRK